MYAGGAGWGSYFVWKGVGGCRVGVALLRDVVITRLDVEVETRHDNTCTDICSSSTRATLCCMNCWIDAVAPTTRI